MHLVLALIDKAPTLRVIWGGALALGLIGYAAVRFRRWLVLPSLALIAIVVWTQLGDLFDPELGPAVVHRAGLWYVGQACAAAALAVILCILGLAPKRAV
ncbi:MAG TPA: hypothetical protein VGQ29_05250 [Gemmatimonadales bacterium]|jgi:hypothetical protein|nr:hypothetical protein [Gemmatimonadales bacterium]